MRPEHNARTQNSQTTRAHPTQPSRRRPPGRAGSQRRISRRRASRLPGGVPPGGALPRQRAPRQWRLFFRNAPHEPIFPEKKSRLVSSHRRESPRRSPPSSRAKTSPARQTPAAAPMKLVHRNLTRNGPGSAKLLPEEEDDLWHAYNLIAVGDTLQAVTVRKVLRDSASGGRDAERVKLKLEIEVESVDYDNEGSVLRVRGKNITENDHVKIGQFHTLELELKRPFVLRKENWDWLALDTIQQACDPTASADLAVILMQEGLAHVFLIGKSITATRARIETSIPRKHGPAIAGYESALKKFFEHVLQALLKHIDFEVVKCVVIASPGFTKDQFRDYMHLEAARRDLRVIVENKSRIILAHAPSGYKHSLKDVLDSSGVMPLIKDTKAAQEVQALKEFFAMLSNDSDRACYGPKHVEIANDRLAIQTLLMTDTLFRNTDIRTRKKYVNLVESVKKFGGTVYIFSSMHVSGDQLAQLTGIAAILRFPLPELEDIEM